MILSRKLLMKTKVKVCIGVITEDSVNQFCVQAKFTGKKFKFNLLRQH